MVCSSDIAFCRSEKNNALSFDSLAIPVIKYDDLLITLLQKIISAETVSVFVFFSLQQQQANYFNDYWRTAAE